MVPLLERLPELFTEDGVVDVEAATVEFVGTFEVADGQ
jgi:hypothetical protein